MKNRVEYWNRAWRAATFCLAMASPLTAQSLAVSVVGEVHDSSTGAVWRLVRDDAHPGGPARWMLAAPGDEGVSGSSDRMVLIHAGDRIVVEEHTAVADARLVAIAQTSAAKGEKLRARMAIGGGFVIVRALTATVAELAMETKR